MLFFPGQPCTLLQIVFLIGRKVSVDRKKSLLFLCFVSHAPDLRLLLKIVLRVEKYPRQKVDPARAVRALYIAVLFLRFPVEPDLKLVLSADPNEIRQTFPRAYQDPLIPRQCYWYY